MKSSRHIARLAAAVGLVVGAGVIAIPGSTLPVHAVVCASTLCGGGGGHQPPPTRTIQTPPPLLFAPRPAPAPTDAPPPAAKPLSAPEPATFDIGMLGLGGIPKDPA